jgi:hypothetical protein
VSPTASPNTTETERLTERLFAKPIISPDSIS